MHVKSATAMRNDNKRKICGCPFFVVSKTLEAHVLYAIRYVSVCVCVPIRE
jgi:hypothetical protein